MSATKVLKMMKDNDVKYVDLRFTDTSGKEQHVTMPAKIIDADFFKDGKMFDGSSIAGWKGINESDMILMPEASHRGHGSVHRRADHDPALRHPRADDDAGLRTRSALRRQARRGLPEVHRIADTAYFGPGT